MQFLTYHPEVLRSSYCIFILTLYPTFFLAHALAFYLAFYLACILTFFLASYLASILKFYLASFQTFFLAFSMASGWHPAMPTERSGACGWGQAAPSEMELAVKVRQCPLSFLELAVEVGHLALRSGALGWGPPASGPAVPTKLWSSQLSFCSAHWDLALADWVEKEEKDEEEKATLRKSKETLTWQVRKNENASNNFTKYQITAALHPSISSLPTFLHSYIPQPTSC